MNRTVDGFKEVRQGKVRALVAEKYRDVLEAIVLEEAGCKPLDACGRGAMLQFSLDGGVKGVLRICRRGGLIGRILKQGFLLWNRPFMEFCIHQTALAKGIPAPELLGVRWKRCGLLFYGALATVLLPGLDLHAWLKENKEREPGIQEILDACGSCIRLMHDQGIYHADLQLKNLFVADTGVFLLDFDKARVYQPLSSWMRARNLLRLRRSFEKRGYPVVFWQHVLEGYGDIEIPRALHRAYRVKACFSDMIQGRRNMQV